MNRIAVYDLLADANLHLRASSIDFLLVSFCLQYFLRRESMKPVYVLDRYMEIATLRANFRNVKNIRFISLVLLGYNPNQFSSSG